MEIIVNSLTELLDSKFSSVDEIDQFIDNLENEIFGIPNRKFYLEYKGDIKELLDKSGQKINDISFEYELLAALNIYCNQRKEHS